MNLPASLLAFILAGASAAAPKKAPQVPVAPIAQDVQIYAAEKLRYLEVDQVSGDVQLSGWETPAVRIALLHNPAQAPLCVVHTEHHGERLKIITRPTPAASSALSPSSAAEGSDANAPPPNKEIPCQTHLKISLPPKIQLRLSNQAGNVTLDHLEGMVRASVATGNLRIDSHLQSLQGTVEVGDIDFTGSVQEAQLRVTRGNITLAFATVADKGSVAAISQEGTVVAIAPQDARITAQLQAERGEVISELPLAPNGAFALRLQARQGDTKLLARSSER